MKWSYYILLSMVIFSCQQDEEIAPLYFPELMEIPKGFPAVETPEGNAFSQARWDLGKRLFFDPIMSVDSTVSCASCHVQSLAFSDDVAVSLGVEDREGTRNASPLYNLAYHPYFTREGGVPTLEMQILVPIQEHNEFDFNIVLLAERLQNEPDYVAMSQKAYAREPDAFVITRALANFERSLLSGNSPYDQYTQNQQENALNEAAIRGMDLFFSDQANCSKCHNDFNFTNYTFENNGLYAEYADEGRLRLTGEEADRALFKVPSLRNIELTSPYMHDGSMQTLDDIIEHYNSGGKNNPQKSEFIQALNLTSTEKADLKAFLLSLTDETFVNNPLFKSE